MKRNLLTLTALSLILGSTSAGIATAKSATVKSATPKSTTANSAAAKSAALNANTTAASTAQPGEKLVEDFRKKAPNLPPPRPFNPPKVESYKLDNGLEVQLVEDHRFPFLSANLGFRTGSSQEPKDKPGIADMTSTLLTEGTDTKKSKDIAGEADFIGGTLKALSDYDYSILSGSCLSAYQSRMFDLLTDVLLHPSFPEDELALQKVNQIQELTMKRSNPDFLMEERFSKVVFGNHPYSIVSPTEADINKLKRDDLKDYWSKHYLPNNAVLIVVGDFNPATIKKDIESHFGTQWKPDTVPVVEEAAMPDQKGRRIYLVDRPGSVQTSIRVGNRAIKRNDKDFFPMLVANQILGGTAHARLFLNIREAKGYTYGAYSKLAPRKEPGEFFAKADVRTEVTNPSLQEFLYELERLRTTKVKDEEIQAAKNYLAGSFQLGLETQGGLAQRLLEAKLFDLPGDYLATYADKVMAVNVDDVRTAAGKLINSDNLVICVVGDARKIKSDLELFAPVSVYDMQGLSQEATPKEMN